MKKFFYIKIKAWLLSIYFGFPEIMQNLVYKKYVEVVKGHHYKKYVLCSVQEYTQKYLQKIIHVGGNNKSIIYNNQWMANDFLVEDGVNQWKTIDIPNRYVAELYDISVRGGCSFLLSDKSQNCMDDIECMYPGIQYIRNDDVVMSNAHAMWVRQYKKTRCIEKGIFLLGYGSTNYYHLTIEILSRLKYVDDLQKYKDWPLLIDKEVFNVAQYRELVNMVNVFDHPIIYIEKKINYKIKHLVYPSPNTWIPFHIKKNEVLDSSYMRFSKEAFSNIRDIMLESTARREPFRKIYVSRAMSRFRRLVNEDAIQSLFEKYGFEIVYPETMKYKEQVAMFNEAKYVAGMSGAAMTNLIYCDESAVYITFANELNEMCFYPTVAKLLGLTIHILPAELCDKTGTMSTSTFVADIVECENYLKYHFD